MGWHIKYSPENKTKQSIETEKEAVFSSGQVSTIDYKHTKKPENMAQWKKQNKTTEIDPKEREITEFLGEEFKIIC